MTNEKTACESRILTFQSPSKSCQDECCGDAPEAVPGLRHQPPDRAEGLQQGAGRQADAGQPAQREQTGQINTPSVSNILYSKH